MGLAIVYGIVKGHNGEVIVEAQPGKGACFTLLFPDMSHLVTGDTEGETDLPSGSENVLLVDDEPAINSVNRKILEKLGYSVEFLSDPLLALNLFSSRPDAFDLVITDMTMPQMTGMELTHEIKSIQPEMPVIICTGYSELIDEAKAEELGYEGYLKKPVSKRKLAEMIRTVLDAPT